jgi:hypothetical protein
MSAAHMFQQGLSRYRLLKQGPRDDEPLNFARTIKDPKRT